MVEDGEGRVDDEPDAVEVLQEVGGVEGDAGEGDLGAGGYVGEGAGVAGFDFAVFVGNGVAVGVELGVAEELVELLDELWGADVLELLGGVVDLVPPEAEFFDEEDLPEAVFADDAQGDAAALGGEAYAAVGLVAEVAFVAEALDHVGDRGGGGFEFGGEGGGGDRGVGPGIGRELEHGLEVVLFGAGGQVGGRAHALKLRQGPDTVGGRRKTAKVAGKPFVS